MKNINEINKITMVVAKFIEIIHWMGVFFSSILLIFSIVAKDDVTSIIENRSSIYNIELNIYGFDVTAVTPTGETNMISVTLSCVCAIIILALMAMVFRNIYLIIKTLIGENKFTKTTTPFQQNIIRMLKEIGMFSISVPVVGLFFGVIICALSIINGIDGTEISVDIQGFIIGLISFSLTNIFTYGAELEKDVDGLL